MHEIFKNIVSSNLCHSDEIQSCISVDYISLNFTLYRSEGASTVGGKGGKLGRPREQLNNALAEPHTWYTSKTNHLTHQNKSILHQTNTLDILIYKLFTNLDFLHSLYVKFTSVYSEVKMFKTNCDLG